MGTIDGVVDSRGDRGEARTASSFSPRRKGRQRDAASQTEFGISERGPTDDVSRSTSRKSFERAFRSLATHTLLFARAFLSIVSPRTAARVRVRLAHLGLCDKRARVSRPHTHTHTCPCTHVDISKPRQGRKFRNPSWKVPVPCHSAHAASKSPEYRTLERRLTTRDVCDMCGPRARNPSGISKKGRGVAACRALYTVEHAPCPSTPMTCVLFFLVFLSFLSSSSSLSYFHLIPPQVAAATRDELVGEARAGGRAREPPESRWHFHLK